jgi:hypothetical protein
MRLALYPARAGRLAWAAVLALLAVSGAGGCAAIDTSTASGGRVELISELVHRLDRAGALTYTAVYRLPQGDSATISQAQQPFRAAYLYPGGKLILGPDGTADCRTQDSRTVCTLTAAPSPGTDPGTALLGGIAVRGMVAPVVVISLLTAAALDADAVVTTHDTTLAGQNATCVDITGVRNAPSTNFDVCVTTDGLLASFAGTVGGARVDVHLDRYDQTVAPDAFDRPPGARLVDQRPK